METYYANTLFDLVKQTIPDGVHLYHCTTNNIEIEFQMINYNTDIVLNSATTFGNTTVDTQMLILKFNKNLTVNSGITLIPQVRKKGMVVYVSGTLINNGKISMTARGASATGQDVYLYNNEYVPAIGGNGGKGIKGQVNGNVGINGTNRSTGGGGAGASMRANTTGGNGGSGTSYSGGTGGNGGNGSITLTELINPISQIIKTKVYDEIVKAFLNKNITTFSIENDEFVENISSSKETITESESTMKTMLKATINQAFEDNNLT